MAEDLKTATRLFLNGSLHPYRLQNKAKWASGFGESTALICLITSASLKMIWRNDDKSTTTNYWALSHPKHHANEDDGQESELF